jgi:hypothetical protein
VIVVIAVHGPVSIVTHRSEKRDWELDVVTMCENEDRGMSKRSDYPIRGGAS